MIAIFMKYKCVMVKPELKGVRASFYDALSPHDYVRRDAQTWIFSGQMGVWAKGRHGMRPVRLSLLPKTALL